MLKEINTEAYGSYLSLSQEFQNEKDTEFYWKCLILIGCFYLLPSLQFVFFQSNDSNAICYYNNKCKKDLYFIPAFNNVISNILYVLLGLIFVIIVKLNKTKNTDGISYIGINNNCALYYSLGIALFFEGLCSATYHICPSTLNFQFDTTFMFIGNCLMFLTIYQKRHIVPSPMKFYSFCAMLIFINTIPLSGLSHGFDIWLWGGFFLLMAYLMIFGSIYLYYDEEYNLSFTSFKKFFKKIKNIKKKNIPKLLLVVSLNTFTLGMFVFATITKPNFTDWLLGVCIINLIIYYIHYLFQKIRNKEKIGFLLWIWMFLDIIILVLAVIFFFKSVSNKFLTQKESDLLNHPCVFLDYFDYHDIWHILSAIGLFIFFNIVYFLDSGIDIISDELPIF